jgi:hypothetical protein
LVTLSEDKRLYQASQYKVKYLKENVKMEFTEFEQYFSTQRISRYVQATNKSEKQAMKAYKANSKVTSGKIIAEQTLGFWTDLFEVHHYRLLKGKPIQIFNLLLHY